MKDRTNGLFEPDALLPAQFYAILRGGSVVAGERRLMLAILEDAVDCYRKYATARDGQGLQLFRDVDVWIASRDRRWFYSYENICDVLEINSDYLRGGLSKWSNVGSADAEAAPARAAAAG